MSSVQAFLDVFGVGSHADPYPHYAALRTQAPAVWNEQLQLWLVTRHADVVDVLRRIGDFSAIANERQSPAVSKRRGTPNIITLDRPDHQRLRQILQKRFTNRELVRYDHCIADVTARLLRNIADSDDVDLVRDLSVPLPVTVIASAMGIELDRLHDFKRWSDALVRILTIPDTTPEWQLARTELLELIVFFREQSEQRRANPNDDIIGLLTAAEQQPGRISANEIVSYCLLLLAAGNETTTNLIGGMVIALLEHPDELNYLTRNPDKIPQAVEEGLRYCAPVQVLFRRAKTATTIGDVAIGPNEDVGVCYASANRDERVFDAPGKFSIRRDPSNHMGFGYGLHHCLGAHLARREASAAIGALLPLLPKLRPAFVNPVWVDSWVVRGPQSLPFERA
jgi:cytochrome P450